jgi:hypothetical protein
LKGWSGIHNWFRARPLGLARAPITKGEIERIDAAAEVRIAKRHLDKLDTARTPMVVLAQVEAHEAGLLFVDGKLAERLPAERHAFWAVGRTVKVAKIDTRPMPLEVTAQERELLNKVVEAERTAKANLIRRQEETAATRDLEMLRGHRRVRLSEPQRLVGGNLGACNLDGLRAEPVAVVERHEAARTEHTLKPAIAREECTLVVLHDDVELEQHDTVSNH